jgi:diaminopimelate decarboxylase
VHASTHYYLSTGFEDQKFGVDFETAWEIVDRIRQHRELLFLGLHGHIGSQIFEASGFKVAACRLVELHAKLCDRGPIPELNLGGGFGIAYVSTDEVQPMNEIFSDLVDTVAETCAELHVPIPDLVIEPGRWIIGPAGITLYTVGVVKDVKAKLPVGTTRRYISINGGMSDNLRPALYGARYTSCVANRSSDSTPVLVRVVGKHCEAGDIVVNTDWLPEDTSSGDLLAVAATGAYCHSLLSNYNMLPRPAVVAVQDHGADVIVRVETEEDVVRRDPGCQAFIDMGGARSFYDRDCRD